MYNNMDELFMFDEELGVYEEELVLSLLEDMDYEEDILPIQPDINIFGDEFLCVSKIG